MPHPILQGRAFSARSFPGLFPLRPTVSLRPFSCRVWQEQQQQRHRGRFCLSASESEPSTSSRAEPGSASPEDLKKLLAAAVASEDYGSAASLKRKIDALSAAAHALAPDSIPSLKEQLQAAITDERYQDAARLRDQLQQLETTALAELKEKKLRESRSDTVTEGVRVTVESYYAPAQSNRSQHYFVYKIAIINESNRTVQLSSRHWKITDGTGLVQEVRGPGVVGKQPVLPPQQQFEYSSACPLQTPDGSMEGSFQMVTLDEHGERGATFEAKVGRFGLSSQGPLHAG